MQIARCGVTFAALCSRKLVEHLSISINLQAELLPHYGGYKTGYSQCSLCRLLIPLYR